MVVILSTNPVNHFMRSVKKTQLVIKCNNKQRQKQTNKFKIWWN